ncbi:MAG: hypothetical protein ACFFA6_08545 [Promethearchaeota archaeon]
MSVKLERVSLQIKRYMENLAYNGLNLVTKDNIKEIELFLQNSSQLEAYRLATSLRYLHIELKRFLTNNPAFNIERYIFFLSNCWLQSRAFISTSHSKRSESLIRNLMGTLSESKVFDKLKLRTIGIEKILLEGTLFGLIFYFISLSGKSKGKILKWSLMQPPRGILQPEILLNLSLNNSHPASSIKKLLFNIFEVINIPGSLEEGNIYLNEHDDSKILIQELIGNDTNFNIKDFDQFFLNSKDIYTKITKNYKITPFDLPTNFLDYIYVRKVKISNFYKEGKESFKNPLFVFKVEHEQQFPLFIRIFDKIINQNLIRIFQDFHKKDKILDGLFCKLILERGQIALFPLSIIEENQITFPSISMTHSIDNRELLQKFYKLN